MDPSKATEDPKCPKCGNNAICLYMGDIGGVDYQDLYRLRCPCYGYEEDQCLYGGSPVSSNWPTNCPFCGVVYGQHETA